MPEGLQTPDGKPVDVDQAERDFAKAMAAPPADADAPDPPKRPAAQQTPVESPKRQRGRPPKSARARTETTTGPELSEEQQEALKAKRVSKVTETAEMVGAAFLVAGKATGNEGFKADAYTFQAVAPSLASAAAEVAKYDPAFARFIDRSGGGKVTAYLSLATVGLSIGSQLAANHGMIKAGFMNTSSPADIIRHYEAASEPEAPSDGDAATPE